VEIFVIEQFYDLIKKVKATITIKLKDF